MATVAVYNMEGVKTGSMEVSDSIFCAPVPCDRSVPFPYDSVFTSLLPKPLFSFLSFS